MKSRSKNPNRPARKQALIFLFLGAACLALVFPLRSCLNSSAKVDDDALVRSIVTAEETQISLAPKMRALSQALLNLRLPGEESGARDLFAHSVRVVDLGPMPVRNTSEKGKPMMETRSWPVATEEREVAEVNLWRTLLDEVKSFDHAQVFIEHGQHPGENWWHYEAVAGLVALAEMKNGEWRSLRGKMRLNWSRPKIRDAEAGEWQITAWLTEELQWSASPRLLFAEALNSAISSTQQVAMLRRSRHYEETVRFYRGGMKQLPHPYFAPISVNQKEGLAVADINRDGFDDIYITVRIGRNMLLLNQRNGTFVESAAQYRLDLPGHTTCALLADFDNDGDVDAMLGRSLLKSTYLENREGVFHQHPIPDFMPMAVISMAAADYNRDGLLDVYMCTYRPAEPIGAGTAGGRALPDEGAFDWPDEFFSPEMAQEYRRRVAEHRQRKEATVLDQLGPPNLLLVNLGGGRFEPAPENETIGLWRNSLQATWGDFDEDGDPDLFVANDWAPSPLYRNDGPDGFVNVSEERGITEYGFSMGASWGDYDNDGLEDIYVSNMHSGPGSRMAAAVDGLSRMFVESAAGNWLHRQTDQGTFEQVAGMDSPAMTVMNAGWSWGGCFVDFDNDRYLDLYVLSGYFTAPEELDSGIDLESNLWRTMLRGDEKLTRQSFRFSPEWKRTGPPDHLGPQIDARMSGVDRQGERIVVHSLNGHERNHYFANQEGRGFEDISGLTGLDQVADSRGFAVLDYDRDGWQDVALVNANQPLFNLYRNEMARAGLRGGMIAIRFVGGNTSSQPHPTFACRDGYGARVTLEMGGQRVIREHRCGDGWSTQNSSTMIVGIGSATMVDKLTVRWPSGQEMWTGNLPEGALLTIYENLEEAPGGQPFVGSAYRVNQ